MRFPSYRRGVASFSVLISVLAGCGASDPGATSGGDPIVGCSDPSCDPDGGLTGGGNTATSGSNNSGGSTGADNTGGTGGAGSTGSTGEAECAKVEVQATPEKQPVDIIWVIDSSGSMSAEAKTVQDNMNAFVQTIASSGLDYRVVVITSKRFVKVPDPLGSDTARFLFIDEDVGSNEPLEALINRYDSYKAFLRSNAATHFVVVTDDEARKESVGGQANVDTTRSWFDQRMTANLAHGFILHGVIWPPTTEECARQGWSDDDYAVAKGEVYYALAQATGGLTFAICKPDWSPLFKNLSTAVIQSSGISCDIPMPAPPPGRELDPKQISINLTSMGNTSALSRVASQSACTNGAWHYDNEGAPTRIVLCDATCMDVRKAVDSAIAVQLGCAPEVVDPE